MVGVEALLRWRSPSRGLVPPAEFIPIAEATGLIRDLGARVLDEACARARRWRDEGRQLPVWVNVAAAQLRHADFVLQVAWLLERHALPADMIGLDAPEPALSRANRTGSRRSRIDWSRWASGSLSTTSAPATRRWWSWSGCRSRASSSTAP